MKALPRGCALILLALAGCGKQAPPPDAAAAPFAVEIPVLDLMNWILDPNADVVWAAAGTIVTAEGEEKFAPTTDEQWTVVRNSAATVLESGNLLMLSGRARNQDDWMKKVQEMMGFAKQVLQAAEAKDAETLFTAGSSLYESCANCHAAYIFSEPGASTKEQ